MAQYDGRAPFQHWISRIAVHAALDHLRKQKRSRPAAQGGASNPC
ncbi:MAG: hypothetical protein H7Y43_04110 [Akkermansiaceae bacterium]|nr:hypothetical protein [Verrucomicrobiales bacterium]